MSEPTLREVLEAVTGLRSSVDSMRKDVANLVIAERTTADRLRDQGLEVAQLRGNVQTLQGEVTTSSATIRKEIVTSCGLVEAKVDTVIEDVRDVRTYLERLNEITTGVRLLAKDAFDVGKAAAQRIEKIAVEFYRYVRNGDLPEDARADGAGGSGRPPS